jgi:hypothetical protein
MVFAFDEANAIQQYIDYRESFFGSVTHLYELREFSRWKLTGDQTALRELMDLGVIGIAGWSPTNGWSIYPPDHEMAGE